ncbi:DNA repair protein rad5 [Colletotrichum kahawae]|uniref:DNA repair protein rad5 n=1 Tax=Colletotrichum kahawae TaxID=34407 RepID=A0AAE0D7K8_COLKA|nr:DNA repair protein rad5 [Colletotrichum kahawae]
MSVTDDDENDGDSSVVPSAQLRECFPELMVEPPRTQFLSPLAVHQASPKVYDDMLPSTWPTKIHALIEDISKCATGTKRLTLTAASRAYLLEPQWNPAIEEQALARIHRLGQTQEVTTIRFVMKDSIEQVCTSNTAPRADS